MSYPTQFPEWLSVAARDGLGGAGAEPPAISVGQPNAFRLSLASHPVFGDWTAGAFVAELRAAPGAGGSALATYTATIGTPASGITPVDFLLGSGAQGGLPAISADTGLAEVFLEIAYLVGGNEYSVLATRQLVRGVV